MSIRDVDELLARIDRLIAEEQPGPLLQVGRRLTDDEAEEIAARWRAAHAMGIRTAVVEAGPVELPPTVDVPWWRRAWAALRRPRW